MATKRGTTKKRGKKGSGPQEREIDLRFILPPDLPIHYVDNIQVTHTATEFMISFLQSRPPLLMSEEQWSKVKSIESKCVSRIVLNPMKMQLFVQALTTNFGKYVKNYLQQEQEPTSENGENPKTGNDANARKSIKA